MPGLRLGYMVLPKAIGERVAALKYGTDISTSGFIQRAFALFLQGKGWESHKNEISAFFGERYSWFYAYAKNALNEYFDISDPCGGLILWLRIRKTNVDTKALCMALAKAGAAVIPGSFYSPESENIPYIALSFADITQEQAGSGIDIIKDVCEKFF